MIAVQNGHEKIVEMLLEKQEVKVNYKNNNGTTALILTAGKGYEGIAKAMLKKDAKVNQQANDGATALMSAA